jgi:hypothetical protein
MPDSAEVYYCVAGATISPSSLSFHVYFDSISRTACSDGRFT